MAARIGLKREWFQPKSSPHYDLTASRRGRAVRAGAIELGAPGVRGEAARAAGDARCGMIKKLKPFTWRGMRFEPTGYDRWECRFTGWDWKVQEWTGTTPFRARLLVACNRFEAYGDTKTGALNLAHREALGFLRKLEEALA